jgi:hypothetical protein
MGMGFALYTFVNSFLPVRGKRSIVNPNSQQHNDPPGFTDGRGGQVMAEYSLLMWLFTLAGVATLVTFFFAFEEGVIGYYEDIVNIVCLPIP